MKKLKAQEIAQTVLDGWRVHHPDILKRLTEIIMKDGKAPSIKIIWDSKKQDIDFEVLK